jgi:hypothetical protein
MFSLNPLLPSVLILDNSLLPSLHLSEDPYRDLLSLLLMGIRRLPDLVITFLRSPFVVLRPGTSSLVHYSRNPTHFSSDNPLQPPFDHITHSQGQYRTCSMAYFSLTATIAHQQYQGQHHEKVQASPHQQYHPHTLALVHPKVSKSKGRRSEVTDYMVDVYTFANSCNVPTS